MTPPREVRLNAFGQEAVLWPELGGRIARWTTAQGWEGLAPIARDLPLELALRAGGCYPLAPYSNRIAGARFPWRGRDIRLAESPVAAPHSLHGVAWMRPFRVARLTRDLAVLELDHEPDPHWPWAFSLSQTVRLSEEGLNLTLTLALTNTDDQDQPVGLGFHPFFPQDTGAHLTFAASGWWRLSPDRIPLALEPVPEARDFAQGRAAPRAGYDDLYAGWDGAAVIDWPASGRALLVRAEARLDHVMLFTPAGGAVFAFEPIGHPINAHNLPGAPGLAVLSPGKMATARMRLSPSPLGAGADESGLPT